MTTTCISHVANCAAIGVSELSGGFTTGVRFVVSSDAIKCSGVKFWGVSGRSYRCSLWTASGRVTYVDVGPMGATGVTEAAFAAAQSLSGYTDYRVSIRETGGTYYNRITVSPPFESPLAMNPWVVITNLKAYATGDANPSGTASSERYPVEPLLTL